VGRKETEPGEGWAFPWVVGACGSALARRQVSAHARRSDDERDELVRFGLAPGSGVTLPRAQTRICALRPLTLALFVFAVLCLSVQTAVGAKSGPNPVCTFTSTIKVAALIGSTYGPGIRVIATPCGVHDGTGDLVVTSNFPERLPAGFDWAAWMEKNLGKGSAKGCPWKVFTKVDARTFYGFENCPNASWQEVFAVRNNIYLVVFEGDTYKDGPHVSKSTLLKLVGLMHLH
jgi:hypothetical protein